MSKNSHLLDVIDRFWIIKIFFYLALNSIEFLQALFFLNILNFKIARTVWTSVYEQNYQRN